MQPIRLLITTFKDFRTRYRKLIEHASWSEEHHMATSNTNRATAHPHPDTNIHTKKTPSSCCYERLDSYIRLPRYLPTYLQKLTMNQNRTCTQPTIMPAHMCVNGNQSLTAQLTYHPSSREIEPVLHHTVHSHITHDHDHESFCSSSIHHHDDPAATGSCYHFLHTSQPSVHQHPTAFAEKQKGKGKKVFPSTTVLQSSTTTRQSCRRHHPSKEEAMREERKRRETAVSTIPNNAERSAHGSMLTLLRIPSPQTQCSIARRYP